MQHYTQSHRTWHGVPRSEIPSRQRPARPEPYIGRVLIDLPGFALDWTLHQDRRDMRRFRAVDLDGIEHEHAAPRELMRRLALVVPHYSGWRE